MKHTISIVSDAKEDMIVWRDCCLEATEACPDGVSQWMNLARAYYNLHDNAQALASLKYAAKLDPQNVDLLLDISIFSIDFGDLVFAYSCADEAARLAPDNWNASAQAGQFAVSLHNFKAARDHLRHATSLHKTTVMCWILLARCNLELHNFPDAVEAADIANELTPYEPITIYFKGLAYLSIKDYARSHEAFAEFPDQVSGKWKKDLLSVSRSLGAYAKGMMLIKKGALHDAREAFLSAIAHCAEHPGKKRDDMFLNDLVVLSEIVCHDIEYANHLQGGLSSAHAAAITNKSVLTRLLQQASPLTKDIVEAKLLYYSIVANCLDLDTPDDQSIQRMSQLLDKLHFEHRHALSIGCFTLAQQVAELRNLGISNLTEVPEQHRSKMLDTLEQPIQYLIGENTLIARIAVSAEESRLTQISPHLDPLPVSTPSETCSPEGATATNQAHSMSPAIVNPPATQRDVEKAKKVLASFAPPDFTQIIKTQSPKMVSVLAKLKGILNVNDPVLLTGETGTGKDLIVQAIRLFSNRANKEPHNLNCGTISSQTAESTLFGHVEGAYTGANKAAPGWFETADDGILFLNDIDKTEWSFQVKLLGVLESHEFVPMGGTKKHTKKLKARIFAAGSSNFMDMISERSFCMDLHQCPVISQTTSIGCDCRHLEIGA